MEQDAAVFRVGLQLGLVTVSDVVHWADGQVAVLEHPPEALLALSLMANADVRDVIHQLRHLSSQVSDVDVLPTALARGVERLRSDPTLGPVVARGLYQLYIEANYEVPDELLPMGQFEDRFALAEEGIYDSKREVLKDLIAFASRFEDAR